MVDMEALTCDGEREALPWWLLYGNDLVLVAKSMGELTEKVLTRKKWMVAKRMKVDIRKTKMMLEMC